MQTKLHVNISQGIIDVEGDEKFVREIYNDFKHQLRELGQLSPGEKSGTLQEAEEEGSAKPTRKRKATRKKAAEKKSTEDGKQKAPAYKPSLDKNLDTSGLLEFYGEFKPKNNPEKILIFVKFLEEKRELLPCTADQIYTCYRALKQSVPQHFRQVIINTSGRDYGYIEYVSVDDIRVSIIGQNFFDDGLARAGDE